MKRSRMDGWHALGLWACLALGACGHAPERDDGLLRIATSYELNGLDPHREDTLSSSALLSNVYEPLVGSDPDMKLVPRLARTWENPDPCTWVFHLREGVAFHDGSILDAADVVASMERVRSDPSLEMNKKLRGVDAVVARDAGTLEIRTLEPDRTFLQRLTGVMILPRRSARGAPMGVGTGPYRIETWDAAHLRLARHERYWGAPPAFPRVEYALGLDAETALASVLMAGADLAETQGRRVARLDDRYRVERRESLYTKYLGFDLARARTHSVAGRPNPFRNLRVRRALHLAVDREALAAALSTDAVAAAQPVPRFVFGFHAGLPAPHPDLARARGLLREAGLQDGFDAKLLTRRILEEPARLVAEAVLPLGVRFHVETLPDGEFFETLRRGEAGVWLDRVACISGDAYEFLADFLHSRDPGRRLGSANDFGLADAELDRVIERTARIEEDLERRDALNQLMARVMDELPVLPLFVERDVYVRDPRIAFGPRYDGEIRAYEVGRTGASGAASAQAARALSAKRDARNGHRS